LTYQLQALLQAYSVCRYIAGKGGQPRVVLMSGRKDVGVLISPKPEPAQIWPSRPAEERLVSRPVFKLYFYFVNRFQKSLEVTISMDHRPKKSNGL
jgi:hypothetical protein